MLPEIVYSKNQYRPKRTQHCHVRNVHSYEDIEDVVIDTAEKVVTWKKHYGLTEEAKSLEKRFYIDEGHSEEEANEKVANYERVSGSSFQIKSHFVSEQDIFLDGVTGKLLTPPIIEPEHNLMFTDGIYLFYLYIPESTGHAILFEPFWNGRFVLGKYEIWQVSAKTVTTLLGSALGRGAGIGNPAANEANGQ